MWYNYTIEMIFGILIPRTTKYNVISEASLLSSLKNVSMYLNIILYLISFSTNLITILFHLLYIYILIFQLWYSTSFNVRLSCRFIVLILWMLSSFYYYMFYSRISMLYGLPSKYVKTHRISSHWIISKLAAALQASRSSLFKGIRKWEHNIIAKNHPGTYMKLRKQSVQ